MIQKLSIIHSHGRQEHAHIFFFCLEHIIRQICLFSLQYINFYNVLCDYVVHNWKKRTDGHNKVLEWKENARYVKRKCACRVMFCVINSVALSSQLSSQTFMKILSNMIMRCRLSSTVLSCSLTTFETLSLAFSL